MSHENEKCYESSYIFLCFEDALRLLLLEQTYSLVVL